MAGTPNTMALERGSHGAERSNKSASLRSRIADLIDKCRPDIDPKDGFLKYVWSEVENDYKKMEDELATACKEELSHHSIPAAVESRVKSRGSITKSLERREIYRQTRKEDRYRNIHEILQDLHDLVGIRIIVDYLDHIEATTNFITSTFRKEKEPNIFSANRKVGHSWRSWFGAYECTNHHISAEYGEHNPLSYYNGVIFEIQVTSLPANLYNKIAHPLLYKEEAGDLSQGDEIVIDLAKGLAFCYSLCTYYKRHKLDGKSVDTNELELMRKASSSFEGPEFMSSIGELAERVPGVDAAGIKGKSIPRERLEMVLESLLNKKAQSDIGKSVADQLRKEIKDVGRPRIELHAFGRARFDSQDVYQSPVCQEGTQIGAISYIHKWIEEGKTPLLWICSHAGTGKSTLARTIVRDLTTTGQMAAGYFFRRGDVGRNHIRHVIPTIAAQLVLTIPEYEFHLRESIDACKNTDFENMLLSEQFRVLLKNPLSQVGHMLSTKVIIIDALDECVDTNQLEHAVDLLVSLMSLDSIRFRLLVTSRDEDPVRAAILHHQHKELSLATTYHDDNISDIEAILRVGFQRIRKERKVEQTWPTEEQFEEVVQRSTNPSPLFIYATTLLRFLGDGTRLGIPKKRLKSWIENTVGATFTTQLDEMYTTVFKNLDPDLGPGCSENLTQDEKDTLRIILGSIALAVEPLSMNSLVDILGIDPDALELVKACRAVLYIPENDDDPVQMLHKSFSDFLLRPSQQAVCWFNVDERKQNEFLAQGCIRHLKDRLRANICQLQDPAILRAKIQPSIIQRCIPNSLQYASSYWFQHVRKAGDTTLLAGVVETLLYERFLEWIECMAMLGRLDLASSSIEGLRANSQVFIILDPVRRLANYHGQLDSDLGRFLYDAYRFLLKHGPIIQKTPRQVFGSALLFSPTNSIIRSSFWHSRLPECLNVRNMPENWDYVLQRIQLGPSDIVISALAVSFDGKQLASAHQDYNIAQFSKFYIELWQSGTGAHLARAAVPSRVVAMSWARHDEYLIFLDATGQVYRHDFLQQRPIVISSQPFQIPLIRLAAISPTGVVAMVHSTNSQPHPGLSKQCQVIVWDSTKGEVLMKLGPMVKVSAIAISNSSYQIAVVADGIIMLRSPNTEVFSSLPTGKRPGERTILAFSSDENRLFALMGGSVTIHDIHQRCYKTTPAPRGTAYSAMVAFPDEATIAALRNHELWLWHIQQCDHPQCEAIKDEVRSASHSVTCEPSMQIEDLDYAQEIAMSPDGRYLVSLWDNRLYLWQLPGAKLYRPWKDLPSPPFMSNHHLSFSRDGGAVLAMTNFAVHIWVLEQGQKSNMTTIYFERGRGPPKSMERNTIWLAGQTVAIFLDDLVEIWDIRDGGHRLQTVETPNQGQIRTFAYAPGPDLLAIAYDCVLTVLSPGQELSRQDMTVPLYVTMLSFSPDGSMLLYSGSDKDGSDDVSQDSCHIWTSAVSSGTSPSFHNGDFISPPTKYLPLESMALETVLTQAQFIYPSDPHSSDLSASWYSYSTDGMVVWLRSSLDRWYSIQHSNHVPPDSQTSAMVCNMHRPEEQTWIQRGSQRIVQIPQSHTRSCVGYGGKHVAMIDQRRKIVLLEFS